MNDFLDGSRALAEVITDGNQLLNDDGRARDGLHHDELAALDALGDGDFAFARQQRDGAHLAQVHADGVVGLFQGARREIEVNFFAVEIFLGLGVRVLGDFQGRARGLRRGGVFVDVDAVALECGKEVVDFFRRVDFGRKDVVHFVVEQVAALLAHGNELAYRVVFFLKTQSHKLLPRSSSGHADRQVSPGTPCPRAHRVGAEMPGL